MAQLNLASKPELVLRPAGLLDVPGIFSLLKMYSDNAVLLPRNESDIYGALREFFVVHDISSNKLAACSALQIFTKDLGEVRSLAVAPDYLRQGLGRQMVNAIEAEAREIGLTKLMALTYEVEFFRSIGYSEVDMQELPEKVWGACINCHKFLNCDEIAVLKYL